MTTYTFSLYSVPKPSGSGWNPLLYVVLRMLTSLKMSPRSTTLPYHRCNPVTPHHQCTSYAAVACAPAEFGSLSRDRGFAPSTSGGKVKSISTTSSEQFQVTTFPTFSSTWHPRFLVVLRGPVMSVDHRWPGSFVIFSCQVQVKWVTMDLPTLSAAACGGLRAEVSQH
jgi:hypothetical protein